MVTETVSVELPATTVFICIYICCSDFTVHTEDIPDKVHVEEVVDRVISDGKFILINDLSMRPFISLNWT